MPRDRLDDLLAVTEVGLSSLGIEDLLVELLNRVREILGSDTAAVLLERSLLPPSLPTPPGVEFAARYAAREARSVGGDWYDVFTLPSGVLWVVMGDVAGHGLGAAVVMGRVRSALRAYALENHPPDEVVRLVDHKVAHFEVGTLVTLACAASPPPYDHFDLVTAG